MHARVKSKTRNISDQTFAYLLLLPLIAFILILTAYPLVFSLWLSFQKRIMKPTLHYGFAGTEQYIKLLSDDLFASGIVITLRFIIVSVGLSLLIGLGLALILNESFKGRGVLRALVLLPWAVSEYATGLIWKMLFRDDIGLLNGIIERLGFEGRMWITPQFAVEAVAVAFAWHMAPLTAFFLLAGLQFLPSDLHRQARIDGAGTLRRFRSITLPYIKYSILISVVLVTIYASRTVDTIITMTGGGPSFGSSTLTYVVYLRSFLEYNIPYGAAMSYILIIIILVLVISLFIMLMRPRATRKE